VSGRKQSLDRLARTLLDCVYLFPTRSPRQSFLLFLPSPLLDIGAHTLQKGRCRSVTRANAVSPKSGLIGIVTPSNGIVKTRVL
jgi:hypothetical protein